MRIFVLGFAVIAGLLAASATEPANADPYKYCAVYASGYAGGGTNCGFVTLAQCRDTISGVGGTCSPNPFYDGVSFDGPRRTRRAHKRHPQG